MIRSLLIVGVLLVNAICSEDARGSDAVTPAIEDCRAILDDVERLLCYDNIGHVAQSVTADVAPPADTASPRIAEDFGLPDSTDEPTIYRVAMDRCGLASNRIFYFYLGNGQVWKYVGNKKLRYKTCPAMAEISEDRLGYRLRLQGETRWHRILRMK